ncbi:MAG TPA: amidase family protein, partial [Rectinemataceae bacterium]|nr:amidase family protein [Rectinemataceae bacterium]
MSHLPQWGGVLEGPRLDAYAQLLEEREREIGAFLELVPRQPARALGADGLPKGGPLSGLPFAVKDNIAVEGQILSCGSRILEGFRSPYSATCVRRLLEAGAVCIGKTNLDEFGMGSSTENSAYKATVNPWDRDRVPGGSSGGSAAAVAAGMVPFALGTDTGGSVRQPAAFCGLYGLKPSYGAVSRFGLVAYASSLETAGVIARSVDLVETVFGVMAGGDPKDRTSVDAPKPRAEPAMSGPASAGASSLAGRRIGVPRGSAEGLDPGIARGFASALEALRDAGAL